MYSFNSVNLLIITLTILYSNKLVFSYKTTKNQVGNSIFIYPGQDSSERHLLLCTENAVASIIHNRFWFPRQIERFCRCEEVDDLTSKWSEQPLDNYTMMLDNRSQLKFCNPVGSSLPNCLQSNTILSVEYRMESDNVLITSNATCYCPLHTMWKLHQHLYNDFNNGTTVSTYLYRCTELDKCKMDEYCGDIRVDHMSTYYHCSCPDYHYCIHKDKQLYTTTRAFFEGLTYKGYCTKIPVTENHNVIQQ